MKNSYSNNNYVQVMDATSDIHYKPASDVKYKNTPVIIRECISALIIVGAIVLLCFAIKFGARGVMYMEAMHRWNKYSHITRGGLSTPPPLFNASQVNPNEGFSFARKPKF